MSIFNHQSGHYLEIGTAKIYYEIAGTSNKPVLLVLHGGFGTLEDINVLLSDLSSDYTLIGIDSMGHGKSTMGQTQLTYERLQNDVLEVLNYLNIDEVSIIGFSDGGIVAYRLASFSKLKIVRLITIGSRWHYKNAEGTRQVLEGVTADGWKSRFPATYETYQKLNPEPDFDKLAANLVNMWLDPNTSGYANDHIKNLTAPLLIIRGDDDPVIPLKDMIELKETVKGSSFLNVPFAGHAPFINQAKMVNMSIMKFLIN